MAGRRTYTPEVMAELARRYEAGESLHTLSRSLGVRRNSLSRAFKQHGIRTRSFSEAARLREEQGRGYHHRRRSA